MGSKYHFFFEKKTQRVIIVQDKEDGYYSKNEIRSFSRSEKLNYLGWYCFTDIDLAKMFIPYLNHKGGRSKIIKQKMTFSIAKRRFIDFIDLIKYMK